MLHLSVAELFNVVLKNISLSGKYGCIAKQLSLPFLAEQSLSGVGRDLVWLKSG